MRRSACTSIGIVLFALLLGVIPGTASARSKVVPNFQVHLETHATFRNRDKAALLAAISIEGSGMSRAQVRIRCDQKTCRRLAGHGSLKRNRSSKRYRFSNVYWVLTKGESLTASVNRPGRIGRYVTIRLTNAAKLEFRVKRSGCTKHRFDKVKCPAGQKSPSTTAPTVARCLPLTNQFVDAEQTSFANGFSFGYVDGGCTADLVQNNAAGFNTLFSKGDGTYPPGRESWLPRSGYNVAPASNRMIPGDFDGDGKTDLVHVWGSGLNMLRSNGDGTYALTKEGWLPRPDYNVGATTTRFLGADFDGDGVTDLLHVWSGGINSLRSLKDGTFAMYKEGWKPRSDYGFSLNDQRVVAADFDGDGASDLLHIWSGGINSLRSNRDGTFSMLREGWLPRPGYPTAPNQGAFVAADITGDGASDLIHIWAGGINTMRSNRDGTFSLMKEGWLPRPGYQPNPTATRFLSADIDGDGAADLLHIWPGGINTMRSNRDGSFSLLKEAWLPRGGYPTN